MARGYRPVDRDQLFLLPPDMRAWLPADHPVHLVIRVVEEHLDTSAFHAPRRLGGAGAAAYDPDMLLTVLVWAYAHRVTSSRRIEQLCGTDVAFRLICAGNRPDHVTVARFRAAFPGPVAEFFARVLELCARLGMGGLGVVALDGTKIAASAGKAANRTGDKLRKMAADIAAEHARADAAEDALFGEGARGDEVPEDAWRPRRRDERIAAALASLDAEAAAGAAERDASAGEHVDAARAGQPRPGPRPAGADAEVARLNLERATAAQQARIDDWNAGDAAARAATGKGLPLNTRPRSPASEYIRVRQAAAKVDRAVARVAASRARAAGRERNRNGPGPVRNITDPHSRLMPVRGGGFTQGYNAQNVTSADGLIIATELTASTSDTAWFQPMLRKAEDAARLITARRPPPPPGTSTPGGGHLIGLFLADAGYLSEDNLTCGGPDRLIATGKQRDLEKTTRDGGGGKHWASEHIAAMAARLATEEGITAYRQRGHIAETPHGNIKHNMGFRQLSMRGKTKAAAEWTFAATTHNLFKAISTGHLTPAALDALPSQAT